MFNMTDFIDIQTLIHLAIFVLTLNLIEKFIQCAMSIYHLFVSRKDTECPVCYGCQND